MNYSEFFNRMQQGQMVSANWRNVLKLLNTLLASETDREQYLKIFVLYFSLLDEGNTYMLLDAAKLSDRFTAKINGLVIQAQEEAGEKSDYYDELRKEIEEIAPCVGMIANASSIIGDGKDKLFAISDNKLFTRKNFNAVAQINSSVDRLFQNNQPQSNAFDYKKAVKDGFSLTAGQEEVVSKGLYNNLLITGGPGTGKTTSVFFLLLSLLTHDSERTVYLTAPSGKAASRMKESILTGLKQLDAEYQTNNDTILQKISNLKEYTIHRLLSYDQSENSFRYNSEHQFSPNSVFVIDEASMIDADIFAALLNAIPNEAKVFILGDKNQLPSVVCGAVYGALLERRQLKDNIVVLKESKRFPAESEIYTLSEAINTGGDLSDIKENWRPWEEFDPQEEKAGITPICYYSDSTGKDSDMIDGIVDKWYQAAYRSKDFRRLCAGLPSSGSEDDSSKLNEIWETSEDARILCACNEGVRGIQHINRVILKLFYKDQESVSGFYPGELLIITKNNKQLDLYNGDCGVAVKFSGDDTLYLMLKKSSDLVLDDKKVDNRIFKLNDYLFYPIRLISSEDISPAFAITIHKSQGSDYNNILVILPKLKGHPLLNRQIVYTAITRTKKNTYLLSNQENLETARDTVLIRDTF